MCECVWRSKGGVAEGDDGYLYGLFPSSSLCLHLPNRTGYGYLPYTTDAIENRYQFQKKKKWYLCPNLSQEAIYQQVYTQHNNTQFDCVSGFSVAETRQSLFGVIKSRGVSATITAALFQPNLNQTITGYDRQETWRYIKVRSATY